MNRCLIRRSPKRVAERLRRPPAEDERLARLTGQERRILALIADGLTNRQIATELHLAEKTVKNYVSNLLAKLGMERRTQAAVFAARLDAESGAVIPQRRLNHRNQKGRSPLVRLTSHDEADGHEQRRAAPNS